jgi:hypothetical protein
MVKKVDLQQIENQKATPLWDFMDSYNKSIPPDYPAASVKKLTKFRETHVALFKGDENVWIVDKHRKRVMDWLSSYSD